MAIGDDFSVTRSNGNIRHVSGTDTYTGLEVHRWLNDLADDASSVGNDELDITDPDPSVKAFDTIITLNGNFNIDDDAAEYIYGASIEQDGGDTLYSGLRVIGAVNNTSTQLMVIQDNDFYQFTPTPASPFWGDQSGGGLNGDAATGVLMRVLIKTRQNGADIDGKRVRVQARHWGDTYTFFNATLGVGESVASIETTPDAQNTTLQATVTAYADVLNSGGTANAPTGGYQTIDLNNGNGAQPYYSQWTFGAQPDGLKAIWEYTKDLSGNGTSKTIDTLGGELFLGVTHDLNYDNEAGGPFTERETIVWGTDITYDTLAGGTFSAGDYVTIGASGAAGKVVYDNGSTNMIVALEDTSITVLNNDVITELGAGSATAAVNVTILDNDKSGGEGLLLALNDAGATGDIWIQLLTGSAPVDNVPLRGLTSSATADVNGSPVARTVPKAFTGSYTGSYIGAFGVGIDADDLTATDTIEDLLGVTQTPPNNVTVSFGGLVSGEDYIIVTNNDAGAIDYDQLSLNTTLNGGAETSVVVTTTIPTDTPTTGTIRVVTDSGERQLVSYTSYTGSTFTITSSDFSTDNATAGNDVFITYLDKLAAATTESFTSVYSSDRTLFYRIRDGGATPIKPIPGTVVMGSAGGSVTVSRQSDA